MYLIRRFSRILLLLTIVLLVAFLIYHRTGADSRPPEIRLESPVIEISVGDGEEKLLEGVTAYDSADGNVTDTVAVENISTFYGDKKRLVTYVAFDSDGHVARATREMRYTDYESPKFTLAEPLQYYPGSVRLQIGADDCLDGEISSAIKLVASDNLTTDQPGEYSVTFQVANSAGDVSSLSVSLEILENQTAGTPVIRLAKYLDYVPVGSSLNVKSYITSVLISGKEYGVVDGEGNFNSQDIMPGEEIVVGRNKIGVSGEVDTQVPGIYKVVFTMTLDRGNGEQVSGHTPLYIVVR